MLEVAAFGSVSVGKSALLNALFETDAFASDVLAGTTTSVDAREVHFAGQSVRVLDTPGIAEPGRADRDALAADVARRADLVLVVFDKDITEVEFVAVEALARCGKPLVVVLNKADVLAASAREVLLARIRDRLRDHIHPDNVFVCSAAPLRHVVRVLPDGSEVEEVRLMPPDVAALRERVARGLTEEGSLLRRLDDAARESADAATGLPERRRRAEAIIDTYAIGIGVGVAANPVPLLDLFGGGAALTGLVAQLANVYGTPLTLEEGRGLAGRLVTDGWQSLWPAALPIVGGAVLKGVPFVGWLISAAGQGAGAYYLTYVIGHAVSEYFAHGRQWPKSVRETIDDVIARTDRAGLSRRAAEAIRARMGSK